MSFLAFVARTCAGLALFVSPVLATEALYPVPAQESASAAIAADASGQLYAAHTGYDAPNKGKVYFRTCLENCADPGNWQAVEIPFEDPVSVQLAVTADGRPRLLVINATTAGDGVSRGYDYAECDANCLDAASWTTTRIAGAAEGTFTSLFQYRVAQRNFVVDAAGRPYFIFVDANYITEPDHYGAFLMSCEADCTDAGNWVETDLAGHIPEMYRTEQFDQPALAVTPDGRLRVLATVYPFDEAGKELEYGLYYLACDAGCTDRANWIRSRVIEPGSGSYPNPTWDLEVLPDGRPRIALFAGDGMSEDGLDHQLIYMWCDTACDVEDSWNGNVVGWAPGSGESPDLALTGSGQPRIAVLTDHGDVAIVSCEQDCENDGQWIADMVEEAAIAAEDRPTALPFHCDGEVWNAFMPRLALAGDQPWLAYDMVVEARCLYKEIGDPDPRPTAVFHEIWRGSRLAKFDRS